MHQLFVAKAPMGPVGGLGQTLQSGYIHTAGECLLDLIADKYKNYFTGVMWQWP